MTICHVKLWFKFCVSWRSLGLSFLKIPQVHVTRIKASVKYQSNFTLCVCVTIINIYMKAIWLPWIVSFSAIMFFVSTVHRFGQNWCAIHVMLCHVIMVVFCVLFVSMMSSVLTVPLCSVLSVHLSVLLWCTFCDMFVFSLSFLCLMSECATCSLLSAY